MALIIEAPFGVADDPLRRRHASAIGTHSVVFVVRRIQVVFGALQSVVVEAALGVGKNQRHVALEELREPEALPEPAGLAV